jgi:hypothetical protein
MTTSQPNGNKPKFLTKLWLPATMYHSAHIEVINIFCLKYRVVVVSANCRQKTWSQHSHCCCDQNVCVTQRILYVFLPGLVTERISNRKIKLWVKEESWCHLSISSFDSTREELMTWGLWAYLFLDIVLALVEQNRDDGAYFGNKPALSCHIESHFFIVLALGLEELHEHDGSSTFHSLTGSDQLKQNHGVCIVTVLAVDKGSLK